MTRTMNHDQANVTLAAPPGPGLPWASLSADAHEFQYNPQRAFPDFASHGERRAPLNEAARATLAPSEDVRYGAHPLRTLDIFRAKGCAPVHLFLHGGYWRAQDKRNFAFVAGALVPLGITTIIANYELCPASTLDGVVDSALAAFEWIVRNPDAHGGDPARLTISGHSAGAHLAAGILATDWAARGVDTNGLSGVTLISGIYDPAPAILTTVNAQLRLDAELAARHDVERRAPQLACPVAIVVGGREPWHWIDQSFRYSHHLRRHGQDPSVHVLPGHDHFGILGEYLDAENTTMKAIVAQSSPG